MIKKQLLCTFSHQKRYTEDIDGIIKNYDLIDRKIFVFSNVNDQDDMYLTYNIKKEKHSGFKLPNTISIHRKNQTNTLYTLNAMNRLIEDENDGVFDNTFQLQWDLYRNSIILTNDPGVKIVELKLISTVEI